MTTTDDEVSGDPMLTELRGIRRDLHEVGEKVVGERKGRKTTNRLGAALFVILAVFLVQSERDQREDARREDRQEAEAERLDCISRVERAKLVRDGIVAAADEVALFADVDDAQREVLERRVAARVLATVPPPEC